MIAIPCMDTVPVDFVTCLIGLWKPEGTQICFKANSLVYDSRNLLCLTAFENGFDRVLWLDSDMTFPADMITRMNQHMDAGYDLVTGLYFRRRIPTKPVLFKKIDVPEKDEHGNLTKTVVDYLDYPKDSIFPVDGCGFGGVMTSTALLRRVWDKFGPAFCPFVWAGEDISFCYRAKLAGARMICDSTIKLGHIGQFLFTESMYEGGGNA